jgi:hypothetical protein
MKKLITLLIVLLSISGHSQTNNQKRMVVYHRDSIDFYFKGYLDEHRRTLYPRIPDVIISDTLSLAIEHHNNYLMNMMLEDGSGVILMHDEPKVVGEFYYKGNDTLIDCPAGRVRYYDTERYFTHVGEVLQITGLLSTLTKSQKEVAKILFKNWLSSEGHRMTLEECFYTHIGVNISFNEGNLFIGVVTSALRSSIPVNEFGRKEFLHRGGNIYEDVMKLPLNEKKKKKWFKKN